MKLKQAREAAESERIRLLEPDNILADLLDLDYLVDDLVRSQGLGKIDMKLGS